MFSYYIQQYAKVLIMFVFFNFYCKKKIKLKNLKLKHKFLYWRQKIEKKTFYIINNKNILCIKYI